MKVTVIDYGLSNLLSVQHAFAHFGAEVQVTSSPADVLAADALVLPGVGAFQDGMQGLEQLGLIEPIKQKTAQGTLLLGICLGMQMLFDESEEFGLHKGLGLIPGRVARIPVGSETLTGAQVRALFSLRSAAFSVAYSGGTFTFTVTGSGHGVGMSQYGANAMAKEGYSCEEILEHYFTGAQVVQWAG